MQVTKPHGPDISAALWIRGAIFTVVVPTGLGLGIPMLFERNPRPNTVLWFAGWPLIIAGAAFYGSCLLRFLRAGGTPAIYFAQRLESVIGREPAILVSGGLYRVTRNPIYVGVVLAVLGQALLNRSVATAMYGLALWMCFHLNVVFAEEPHLRAQYGDSYEAYCRIVPRWLW